MGVAVGVKVTVGDTVMVGTMASPPEPRMQSPRDQSVSTSARAKAGARASQPSARHAAKAAEVRRKGGPHPTRPRPSMVGLRDATVIGSG